LGHFKVTYKPYGNQAILVEWPSKIDDNILKDIITFKNKIKKNNIKVIVDIINTYNSLTIIYNSTIENIYDEILTLKSIKKQKTLGTTEQNYLWNIPVCYDGHFGIDLQEISDVKKLTIDELILLHSLAIYTVYFIGFLPGFLYLGGMDERLNFPRKSSPRLNVAKGSVGIGGSQTGIYPSQSAGGWNIIGNSPISFFNVTSDNPCFAKAGDKIKFEPIDFHQYQHIVLQVAHGMYKLKKERLHD
jgi:inhibitor of KinA